MDLKTETALHGFAVMICVTIGGLYAAYSDITFLQLWKAALLTVAAFLTFLTISILFDKEGRRKVVVAIEYLILIPLLLYGAFSEIEFVLYMAMFLPICIPLVTIPAALTTSKK